MSTFEEKYDQLKRSDKNQFAEAVSDLLYECYVPAYKYDRKIKIKKPNPVYLYIESNFALIESYLSYLSISLVQSQEDGVIYITSNIDKNHFRTDSITTLVVYLLRSYYETQISERPESDVIMSLKTCIEELNKKELSTATKRIPTSGIVSALKTLDSFNIINRCRGSFSDNDFSFYILPTIKYVISIEKINYLDSYFNNEIDPSLDNNLFTKIEEDKELVLKQINDSEFSVEEKNINEIEEDNN